MAKIVAQGQLTIVDMHDMPPVQGRLTSNLPKIVVMSSDGRTQNPNWATNNLIVKSELYVAGNPNDLVSSGAAEITGVTWYATLGSAAETTSLPTGINKGRDGSAKFDNKLTINKALLNGSTPALKLRAVVQYRYSGTGESIPVSMEIDFGLANNGTAGQHSYSAILDNTSHVFPCLSNGNTSGVSKIKVSALIYKGTTSLSGVRLIAKSSSPLPSGMTISAVDTETHSVYINVSSGANLGGADSGVIYLTASAEGKNFDLAFSWAKSKGGNNGNDSTSYWAIPSSAAIVKKWNGSKYVFEPTAISVKGMCQKGAGNATPYNTRFKIQLFNGGSALGNETISSGDEASRSLTIPEGVAFTHAKITMYKAGGTSVILDEEEVRLIQEPRKAVVVAVSADTDTIRNNAGSATLRVHVYKDGQDVSASATKKWMKGVSSASVGSSETLTVNASEIATSEIYKCEVTIDGGKYTDSIVIYDVTDPIQMSVLSSNGEVFKNGAGTTNLTCKLWRNGTPLDEEGTKYAYCWHKMNKDGSEDLNWAPTVNGQIVSTKKSPAVAKLTGNSSGATLTVDDVSYIRKGYSVFLGGVTTPYKVNSVSKSSGNTGTVVLSAAPATQSTGVTVHLASMKSITVTEAQVDEKATFFCELIE